VRRGRRTLMTSRLSWSYLQFARRSQRRCFAGSKAGRDRIVARVFSAEIEERSRRVTFLLNFFDEMVAKLDSYWGSR